MRTSLRAKALIVLAAVVAMLATGAAQPGPSAHDLALLNRVTWGASASAAAELQAVGQKRWLEGQIHPKALRPLPAAAQAQIDALTIVKTPMAELATQMDAQQRAANQMADPEKRKAAQQAYQQAMAGLGREAQTRSLLRDLYSQDQLTEQMTWFWFNQFNIHLAKRDIRAMIGDYEDRAIRPRALGKFRDLLEASLRHPAMLRYLDNDQNAAGKINENYAREIMELHTMGVGSGYSQKDVQELARILTGVGVNLSATRPKLNPANAPLYIRDGAFEFNPNRHDFKEKTFLGQTIKGSGYGEVTQALDILARQPATAHRVSQRLATYFVGDTPPQALVERMAKTFQRTDGDIAAVLDALFTSKEFDASLGRGFKDPMHYATSAVRMAYDQRVVLNTTPIQNWLNRMGQGLFNRPTPDGYPLISDGWSGPGQMATRFEIARQIGQGPAGLFRSETPGSTDQPGFPQLQSALYYSSLDRGLGAPTKTALDQAISVQDWNTLFLSSPEFMRR